MILPLIVGMIISVLLAGSLVTLVGYYTPFMIVSSVLAAIGAGLITTFRVNTSAAKWIGYEVLFGFGFGLGFQQPFMAAQVVLDAQDVPTGTAVIVFAQTLGGALFVSVGQNVFTNRLIDGLKSSVTGIDPMVVLKTGATKVKHSIEPQLVDAVLVVYNKALTHVFSIATAVACVSLIGAAGMEWRSVKSKKRQLMPI